MNSVLNSPSYKLKPYQSDSNSCCSSKIDAKSKNLVEHT